MSDEWLSVSGWYCKIFREGDPIIYLLKDGRFGAKHGGKMVIRASVASLDKAVHQTRTSIKLMQVYPGISFTSRGLRVLDVSGFDNHRVVLSDGKKIYSGHGSWYIHHPEMEKKLRKLEEKKIKYEKELNAEMGNILENLQRVLPCEFKDFLEEKGEKKE